MSTTTERNAAGLYLTTKENGYHLAAILKAEMRARPWLITYTGGTPGSATQTLKEAVKRIGDRWDDDDS